MITIRPTRSSDYPITESVVREAFWNVYRPGTDAHYVLHLIRQLPTYVHELDLVALDGNRVVGSVVSHRSYIISDRGRLSKSFGLGPIAVLPEYQRRGIGARLLERSQSITSTMNVRAIVLFGDPNYYSRCGFVPAERFNIRTEQDYFDPSLMIASLGSLVPGRYHDDSSVIDFPNEDLGRFDSRFPFKKKVMGTPTQRRYHELLSMRRRARRE